jgi:ABC-type iron transport system FetAB ATPase subunit
MVFLCHDPARDSTERGLHRFQMTKSEEITGANQNGKPRGHAPGDAKLWGSSKFAENWLPLKRPNLQNMALLDTNIPHHITINHTDALSAYWHFQVEKRRLSGNTAWPERQATKFLCYSRRRVASMPNPNVDIENGYQCIADGPVDERKDSDAGRGPASGAVLVVDRLRRSVGGKRLMPTLSFELRPGQIIFFTGPSGSGKSTALRLIANLDPPDCDSGSITLGSLTPAELTSPVWRSRVMYVPQSRVSQTGTPATLFQRAVDFAVRAEDPVKLTVEQDLLPVCAEIYISEAQVHQEWQELSGGEAQRASLAIALALQPNILLLDESTSALDKKATTLVETLIKNACARSGTSVIWVSHDQNQPGRLGLNRSRDCIDFATLRNK